MALEITVDNIESAINAEKGGADRIELCSNLQEGGVTPSLGLISHIKKTIGIGVYVLIRPRPGDFFYNSYDFEIMKEDIKQAKSAGADGIVSGILHRDGTIDNGRTSELIQLSSPLEFTFHRAFDVTPYPFSALEDIISVKAGRILTSGHKQKAMQGISELKLLKEKAGERIKIMAGSGINPENVQKIIYNTGIQEFHLSARQKIKSAVTYKNTEINLGGPADSDGYDVFVADPTIVNKVRTKINEP